MEWWGVLLTAVMSATFAWHGIRGLKDGRVSVPVRLFMEDEFERGETMFGLVVTLNFIGAIAAAGLSYAIGSGVV